MPDVQPLQPLNWITYLIKWLLIAGSVGLLSGSASALFLTSLDFVTKTRMDNPWLLWLLPIGGAFVSFLYLKFGKEAGKGNNLIIEQIHSGNSTIPLRMAPMVLFGTLMTHLLGGSAGREGTAVQIGGSLAEWFGHKIRINAIDRKIILMCGISSGFGAVFGTPLAGTIFGIEVLAIGIISYKALLPCFIASYTGHLIATAWGIKHITYTIGTVPPFDWILLFKIVIASIIFGLAALLFTRLLRSMKKVFSKWFVNPILKSFIGGLIIIALVYGLGTRDYLGLSIPLLQQSFQEAVSPFVFLLKTLFTAITLGTGFQGGEVTPLFVIGSTLGSALAGLLHTPVPLLAAIGFVAVFSGAAKTPIACFIMGVELFGIEGAVYLAIGCTIAYKCSGRIGIYEVRATEKKGLLRS